VLSHIWQTVLGPNDLAYVEPVNHYLRKAGHFTGYGTLALFIRRAWYATIRAYLAIAHSFLPAVVTTLSVASTFLLGSLDEWHQKFLPGRSSTFYDVMIDTSGALLFNAAFWGFRIYRRRNAILLAEQPQAVIATSSRLQSPDQDRRLAA
jgi:VanZ family protein